MNNTWTLEDGRKIALLTLAQLQTFKAHAPDALFVCIDGSVRTAKNCNDDTRYGYVAYGQVIPPGWFR